MKTLLINSDDFGLNRLNTDAIDESFNRKIITDTTMITNGEAFDYALGLADKNAYSGCIGIHFALNTVEPVTEKMKQSGRFSKDGVFSGEYGRFKPLSRSEKTLVYDEFCAQLKKLTDEGIKPSHADSHHHIHTLPFIAPVFFDVCKKYGINKVRLHRNYGNIKPVKLMLKNMYNAKLSKKGFASTDYFATIDDVENGLPDGVTEIMVHCDYADDKRLVDRREWVNGSDGVMIPEYAKIYPDVRMISYKELLQK